MRITSADGSGIECAMVTNSRSNGPTRKRLFKSTVLIGSFSRPPLSAILAVIMALVNGVAQIGALSLGQRSTTAPT